MNKELVSLSPLCIEPGRLELGPNVPANKVLIGTIGVLVVGVLFAAFHGELLWMAGLVLAAALLEFNRRWANRCHLLIEHGRVRFMPLRGTKMIVYEERNANVDVYSYPPAEGSGMHHAARLRLSHPNIPDILIQEPLHEISNEAAEREASARRVQTILASLERLRPH